MRTEDWKLSFSPEQHEALCDLVTKLNDPECSENDDDLLWSLGKLTLEVANIQSDRAVEDIEELFAILEKKEEAYEKLTGRPFRIDQPPWGV